MEDPLGDDARTDARLTFKDLSGASGIRDVDAVFGIRTEDGRFTNLAFLISDQCPQGITIHLPDGTSERVSGDAATQALRAFAVICPHNPKRSVRGSKSPVHIYPRIAVHEALLNAVCHRDYSCGADTEVVLTRLGLSVVSPGESAGQMPRNPGLQAAVALCDPKAYRYRGLVAITRSYARSGYEPSFSSSDGRFSVFLPAVEEVRGFYGSKRDKVAAFLSGREGGATLEDIAAHLGHTKAYTRDIIWRMLRDGVIARMNGGPDAMHYLCDRRRGRLQQEPRSGRERGRGR